MAARIEQANEEETSRPVRQGVRSRVTEYFAQQTVSELIISAAVLLVTAGFAFEGLSGGPHRDGLGVSASIGWIWLLMPRIFGQSP